ncbi:MAG: exodeoxyribonuclease VII small subunit [Planctomycetota bacterium]
MTKKPQTSKASKDRSEADEALDFDAALAELESIIERIESGEVGLEESLTAYERGVGIASRCRTLLERAEQRVTELGERLDASESDTDA